MMKASDYSPSPVTPPSKIEPLITSPKPPSTERKKKNNNERRFSDEQIRSLECMFNLETKLEPKKKQHLARELGLQPRQVAIWFQNKRARWKSKQIEQEYRVLKANYDNLNTLFESLKKERQSLLTELKKLNDMLKSPHDGLRGSKDLGGISIDGGSDNGDSNSEFKTSPSCLNEGLEHGMAVYSDDDDGGNTGCFRQEIEPELPNLGEETDGFLALPEKWRNFDSGGLFDQSCGTSNWWDFWN